MEDQVAVESPGITIIKRMIGVFTAPRATFSSLVESINTVDIVIPMVVMLVLSLGSQSLVRPIAIEEQTQKILQRDDIPDDRKELMLDRMEDMTGRMSGSVGYLIGAGVTVGWYAILAGVLMFFGAFILGGQAPFKDTVGVVAYAQLVSILELIIKVPLIIQTQTTQVETGLALLLPGSMDTTLLYQFCHRLDFFSMWRIFLMAMGMALLYRVDEKRARFLLFGAWALAMFLLAWLIDGQSIS
ncbi:MAG: YIP1 family protein [Candidatus Neomarinimicrobiota bacterium]